MSGGAGLLPGRIVLKLRPGEAPPAVPTAMDVRAGLARPEGRTGLPAVDRVLTRHSGRVALARVHAAARSMHRPGRRHLGFDELEQDLGLSRTFVVQLDRAAPVVPVAQALANLYEVESAGALALATAPFHAPTVVLTGERPVMRGRLDGSRAAIQADAGLAAEPGLPNVTVAVLDTGIHAQRTWFPPSVLRGFDTVTLGTGDLSQGLDVVGDSREGDLEPDDEVGHGTSAAGIIGARASEVVPRGLAGACTVLPVRVLGSVRRGGDASGFGGVRLGVGSPLDIDVGLKRAVDLGAKVLNLSFGTPLAAVPDGAPVPHADVVAYAAARGCVLVAASGNSGRPEAYTPAILPEVIAVGAVDQDSEPAPFTTSGPHVDLCAPGRDVLTTGLSGPVSVSGTSFAAPFVTAAAALLVSRAARYAKPLEGSDVATLLRSSARPWRSTPAEGLGTGVLDVSAALAALDQLLDRRSPPPGRRFQYQPDGTSRRT
jgi:subtilisin family serine protease